jgi:hypothetical protein
MTTHKLLPNADVCVPKSQVEDYLRVVSRDRLLVHPDEVKGLTPKLNWILGVWAACAHRTFEADALVFVDDDIASVQRCFVEPGEEGTIRDPHLIETIITNTAVLARDVGAY